jgi:lipopolysaccharide transport system ATP-binding protein
MQSIISVKGLSKRYRIGRRHGYSNLREDLTNIIKASLQFVSSRRREKSRASDSYFWAIEDVSFDVSPGEVLGLIGSNGAGKSTILKILSRITRPDRGEVKLYGRVGSLLEVGTGFHPELTGRDNIYLNGAILGMERAEIAKKFDEIVDFSGIEKFIDTPVKRYSSGMYVRLAFAVAAHLQPEILLIDEVLAVGDLAFQKKCLGKIGEVVREGRTVLFVSHNMASVEALCSSCLFMSNGRLVAKGEVDQVVSHYLAADSRPDSASASLIEHPGRRKGSTPMMRSVELRDDGGAATGAIRMGGSLSVSVSFSCESKPITPVIGLVVKNSHGVAILGVNNEFIGGYRFEERIGAGVLSCTLNDLPLMPGRYSLDLYLNGVDDVDVVYDAISLEVVPADVFGTGQLPPAGTSLIYWPASFALTNGAAQKC